MAWEVELKESVIEDLRWFGSKIGRWLFQVAIEKLEADPLAETKAMKTLRENPVAERELPISAKYRVLFNVNDESATVTVVVVGEKKGDRLFVQGKEYRKHHEKRASKQGEDAP